jgi:arginine utilization protein RocB
MPSADRPSLRNSLSRTGELSIEMTRWPSVTESDGEAAFSGRLMALLGDTPYFRQRPENLLALDSHGNPSRQNVLALVRGKGRRCLVLAGHFDTVSIANYSSLVSLACEPEALTKALIDELTAKTRNPAEDKALTDLMTGDFLAGRGLLDMKSGLAAGIAALERFFRTRRATRQSAVRRDARRGKQVARHAGFARRPARHRRKIRPRRDRRHQSRCQRR